MDKISLLLLVLLNLTGILLPEARNRVFETVGLEQGLSQLAVNCIARDRNGFMWFGTQDGLNKYDGYDFAVYRHDPDNPASISDNHIRVILVDVEEPVLWIGTNNGGLCKFDSYTERFTIYRYDSRDPGSLSYNDVYALFQEKNGVLWVGTWGGGLNRFDKKTGSFTRYRHNRNNPSGLGHDIVRAIFEDSGGVMWIGTYGGGLDRFDRDTGEFTHYRFESGRSGMLSNDQVMSICESPAGILWISTDGGGINRFDPAAGTFTRFVHSPANPTGLSNNRCRTIHADRSGALWIATYGGGLDRFDPKSQTFTAHRHNPGRLNSLPHDQVLSLYEDHTEMLWIGTLAGGIARLDLQKKKFNLYRSFPDEPNSLSSAEVRAFAEDSRGILWIGTNGGGLNKLDREKNKYTVYRHDPGNPRSLGYNRVYALYQGGNENVLWVGTFGGGLDRFDKKRERFTHYTFTPDSIGPGDGIGHNRVRTILEDHTGELWLGTWDGGLHRFDRETGTSVNYRHEPGKPDSIGHDKVFCLYEDRAGVLWVGTWGGGLCRYNRETDNFTSFQYETDTADTMINNRVLCIYEDSSGVMWVGSGGRGLNKFDREQIKWTLYTTANGLPNDVIYGILEDEQGNLWLSSNGGISKFDPETETVKNYDTGDGLQSNEFNGGAHFKSASGEMFFGGVNGFNSFFPGNVIDNPYAPPVLITRFKIFNEAVTFAQPTWKTKEIMLSYRDNFISFDFVALNYRSPENNRYAYMLEGFDRDWVRCGTRRTASYTNLQGGNYVFRVRGANNDGLWNEKGASVKITVIPPFWKQWWFRITAVSLLLALVFLVYRYRTYGILDRNKQLVRINKKLNREVMGRRKVEKALRISEEKFRAFFENSLDVHFRVDLTGKLLEVNPSGVRLLGYADSKEMLGKDVTGAFFYNPADRKEFIRAIYKYKKIAHYEVKLRKKDGTPFTVETSARFIYNDENEPAGIDGIFRDITGRTKVENETVRLQEQLLSAKKMEAVGTMAGGMAHEFNNLMATIIGNTGMLQGYMIDDPDFRKRLKSIMDASTRCATLTDQLLAFSRKQFLQLKRLDLNDLIQGLDDSISEAVGDGVEVVFHPAPALDPIEVDSKMMIQVVMGIVRNSGDAMPDGGTLTITTGMKEKKDLLEELPHEPRGKMVVLFIEDTGVGMDEDVLGQIFDPFFTTKEVGKGLGLDLSVVYGTVRQHNGWVNVDSTPGKGTKMTIYLPVMK